MTVANVERLHGGIAADEEYWSSLSTGEFRLSRCAGCAKWTWPAHWRCGVCGSWDFQWEPVEPVGVVYSWTRSWFAFPRMQPRLDAEGPYVVVLAELAHAGGARVIGALARGQEPPRIGAKVRGVIEPPSQVSLGYPALRWQVVDADDAHAQEVK